MAIVVNTPPKQPPLEYKNVHLERLIIEQPHEEDSSVVPVYHLKIIYRLFALDSKGKRYYERQAYHITLEDYLKTAMGKAAVGDMDLINALQAIETALASIIADQGNHGSTNVT